MYTISNMNYSIKEAAKETTLSEYTLRYYEKIGLISNVQRSDNGHRIYNKKNIDWIIFITRLKATGMSLKHIIQYAQMQQTGASTREQRMKLLKNHREKINSDIEFLKENRNVLDRKIAFYKDLEKKK